MAQRVAPPVLSPRSAIFLLTCSACLAGPGCATAWTVSEIAHIDWHWEPQEVVTPAGPTEAHVELSILDLGPPLRVECRTEERVLQEHVDETYLHYGTGFTMLALMSALFDGIASAALYTVRPTAGSIAAGVYLDADALGSVVLALHPREVHEAHFDRPGDWRQIGGCPADAVLTAGDARAAVAPDGSVDTEASGQVLRAVAETGAPLELRAGGAAADVTLTSAQRCAAAQAVRSPAAALLCGAPAPPPAVPLITPLRVVVTIPLPLVPLPP